MKRCVLISMTLVLLLGCSSRVEGATVGEKYPKVENVGNDVIPTVEMIKIPEASGILSVGDAIVEIDYSNTKDGYILAKTKSDQHERLKIQIIKNEEKYNYDIPIDFEYISYPLNLGEGLYTIQVRENVGGSNYALLFSEEIDVQFENENSPYLYPSYIINYDLKTSAIDKSFELCKGLESDLERVYEIYTWIINNISYDWDKVEEVQDKFVVPIIDETMEIKTGICFDYAALMTCMLRVQQIPTKLMTGYVEEGYHSWVEVYLKDIGWIDPRIYFESEVWTLIDPTFDAMDEPYKGSYEVKYNY